MSEPELARELARSGCRSTVQRRAVLRVLERTSRPLCAEELHQRLREEHPRIGLSTVYRTLSLLCRFGAAHKVRRGDGASRYLPGASGPVQCAHCKACGEVIEFDESLSDYLALQVERDSGFVADSCELTLHGLCTSCTISEPALTMTS